MRLHSCKSQGQKPYAPRLRPVKRRFSSADEDPRGFVCFHTDELVLRLIN